MISAARAFSRLIGDRKGMEVQTLVTFIILVVFLLVALIAIIAMWNAGNTTDGELCESAFGFLRGCG